LKIIFIAHYFPPLNSSGARRVNSFAKYLSEWGHDVTVITTKKTFRDGLLTEPVPDYLNLLEINNIGQLSGTFVRDELRGNPESLLKARSRLGQCLLLLKRFMMKGFGQLLDHRLFFAIQFASPLLSLNVKTALTEADVVITSCPPWLMHMSGWLIKKRFKKKWVADYRDQFSGNHILRGSSISRPIELWIDKCLLRSADFVTVISSPMKYYYDQFHSNVFCIENGYDDAVFKEANLSQVHCDYLPHKDFTIRYMGTITADRIPKILFEAIAKLNQTSIKKIIVEFYGESSLLNKQLNDFGLDLIQYVKFKPQLSYINAIKAMLTADALYFIETSDNSSFSSRGVLTTKLFEYLAAKKPIIAEIKSSSLAASYIKMSGLGAVISTDLEDMLQGLASLRDNAFIFDVNEKFIKSLSREFKTREFESLLNKL
jgi:glycosyltransferase involved in cell wall biosynthesis